MTGHEPIEAIAEGFAALVTAAVRDAVTSPDVMDEALTVEGAADFLGVGVDVVYRAVRSGALPSLRVGREYRLSRRRLSELLAGEDPVGMSA